MTTTLKTATPPCTPWPADLREWAGERGLVKLALGAVQTVSRRCPGFGAGCPGEACPQMMLTLLTYCYAAGIHGSDDIDRATRTDETVRYICARSAPGSAAIRGFRKMHRQLVEHCLASVLAEAWKLKRTEANPHLIFNLCLDAETYCGIVSTVREKLDRAIRNDAAMCRE